MPRTLLVDPDDPRLIGLRRERARAFLVPFLLRQAHEAGVGNRSRLAFVVLDRSDDREHVAFAKAEGWIECISVDETGPAFIFTPAGVDSLLGARSAG